MNNILERIREYKLREIEQARADISPHEIEERAQAAEPPRGFHAAIRQKLDQGGYALIAEVKKASPSKGLIRPHFDPPAIAAAYEEGGATCLSVLTDQPSFKGHPEFLRQARGATSLPVLRKDFMFDPYQVVEARAMGADCILIILAAVNDQLAGQLLSEAKRLGMDALVEVHDAAEMERALALKSTFIGINNRNLRTFETRLETAIDLTDLVPDHVTLVAESGLFTHADLQKLDKEAGIRAFLIGESLMRQADVAEATRRILQGDGAQQGDAAHAV